MNEKEPSQLDIEPDYDPPAWLLHGFEAARDLELFESEEMEPLSEEMLMRCREAAEVALTLAKLRAAKKRIGFLPLAFTEYIYGLANYDRKSIKAVLDFFGITDLSSLNHATAKNLARLSLQLGFTLQETLVHLGITFTNHFSHISIPGRIAHRSSVGGEHDAMGNCQAVLREIETEYDQETLRQLRQLESIIRAEYTYHDQTNRTG
ncbi:MAG: hypothetical protein L0226_12410 [Acidobacteria bacterium]|nr:hypothetical protein [Acidobacteriota bacterium]